MAILNLSASFALAAHPDEAAARGTLEASGVVTVNDLPALSGQTIFSGSYIVTASRSLSVLELGDLTRLMMSEQTELALDFSVPRISISLRQGEVRAFIPAARTLSITTADGVLTSDSSQAVVFRVQVEAGFTHISVETGRVELRAGDSHRTVAAGETFFTDCDSGAAPEPQQNLNKGKRIGIIAGIGTGVAAILIAILGRNKEEPPDPVYGGCVVVPSGANDPPGTCL